MYHKCEDKVEEITRELIKIPSIVGMEGAETACAKKIQEYFAALPYFKKYPERAYMIQTVNDNITRHSTIAYVKGTKSESKRTVILLGHFDTVGVEDYGPLKEYAFDPDKLPELLFNLDGIDEQVKKDISSGEFMFGRGALDMKSGIASHMFLIDYFSEHPEELAGNLIILACCDEEDMSNGVITGLKELIRIKEKEGFQYIACINSDFSSPYYPGDEKRYIYFGTVGKVLPSFYVLGREAHVGQAYGGLDPNLVVAELTRLIDFNTDLCDESQGEVTIPPVSLKQADFKELYTVQTSTAAYAYYNFFTHSLSPGEVLEKVKLKAEEAFNNVIEYINQSYKKYCQRTGFNYQKLPWKVRVYSYEVLYNELESQYGEQFTNAIYEFSRELFDNYPKMDLRIFSVKVIEEVLKWMKDKSPAIIIYFSSSYCARVEMTGETLNEKNLMEAVNSAIDKEICPNQIVTRMFFPLISDASFMALSDNLESLKTLEKNMPAWGTKYIYNVEDVLNINVPVVNIGSHGEDGHKFTERVHKKYTFQHVPNITYNTIISLLK